MRQALVFFQSLVLGSPYQRYGLQQNAHPMRRNLRETTVVRLGDVRPLFFCEVET